MVVDLIDYVVPQLNQHVSRGAASNSPERKEKKTHTHTHKKKTQHDKNEFGRQTCQNLSLTSQVWAAPYLRSLDTCVPRKGQGFSSWRRDLPGWLHVC